jgi:hypothetical protein
MALLADRTRQQVAVSNRDRYNATHRPKMITSFREEATKPPDTNEMFHSLSVACPELLL